MEGSLLPLHHGRWASAVIRSFPASPPSSGFWQRKLQPLRTRAVDGMNEQVARSNTGSKAEELRRLMSGPNIVQGPCCYDALSGRLVEMAGFPAAVMSGFSVSATRLGLPDTGLLSYGEMVDQAGLIASSINIPLIADADTGYGNAVNVKRTVKGYRQAGVAALILEDQVWPKGCGHTRGRRVVEREEAVMKIQAAVDARDEGPDDILVVARSDSCQAVSLEEAIWRSKAFADVGADIIFVDALTSREDMGVLCKALPDVPKMVNMLEGGKTPIFSPMELEDLGFKLVVYPLSLLGVSIFAMQEALKALRSGRLPSSSVLPSFEEIKSVVGFPEYYREEDRYAPSNPASVSRFASPAAESIELESNVIGSTERAQFESEDRQPFNYDSSTDGTNPEDSVKVDTCKGDFECDDEQTPEVKDWAADSVSSSSAGRVPGVAAFTSESTESTSSLSDNGINSVDSTNNTRSTKGTGSTKSTEGTKTVANSTDRIDSTYNVGSQAPKSNVSRESDGVLTDVSVGKEEGRKSVTEVVVADEIIQDDGSRESSGRRERGRYGAMGGMWSRVLRVKITDRIGSTKLDIRVPAGFLDGLASTIPAVAGLNLKALLDDKLQESSVSESGALLDFVDRSGDRVQIFLE